jgi:hypothetical protein
MWPINPGKAEPRTAPIYFPEVKPSLPAIASRPNLPSAVAGGWPTARAGLRGSREGDRSTLERLPSGTDHEYSPSRFGTCAKIGLDRLNNMLLVTRDDRPRETQWSRILLVLGISLVLVATIPAVAAAQGGFEPEPTAIWFTAGGLPAVTEYAVTFVETGLPAGTEWNVTIDDTLVGSTSNSIVFQEPDGSYLFSVSQVPGFSTNPEGNVTVSGAPVTVPILFTSTSTGTQGCTSYSWQGGNYTFYGDCRGLFDADLRSFNASSGYTFENSTFDVGAVAELDRAGSLVALSEMDHESAGSITAVTQGNEVNVTDSIVANVTTAIGLNANSGSPNGEIPTWSPSDVPGSVGPTVWGSGTSVLGNISVVIVFHFVIGFQGSDRVKFDISMSGWPWVNPADALGVEIGATAEQQTYFVYSAPNDTIAQLWTSNETVASSLVFGGSANTTAGGANATVDVSNQVGLYPSGNAPDIAFALLSFQGAGGYSALTYDPWIVFGLTPGSVPLSGSPAATGGATLSLIAVGGIASATVLLGLMAYRLRRGRVDEDLRSVA